MTRMVSLTDEAYEALSRLKERDDSFSTVVLRLAEEERARRLKATFGSWKMPEPEFRTIQAGLKQLREKTRPRGGSP